MESRVTLPEGRYGSSRARPLSRTWKWALTGVGLLLAVVTAFVAYRNLGSAPIEAESTAFSPVGTDAVRITFTVTRDQPSKPAVCVVRARVLDGTEGGRKEVLISPGESTVSTVIKSSAEPVTADVFGCSYQVPPYLSTEAPPTE